MGMDKLKYGPPLASVARRLKPTRMKPWQLMAVVFLAVVGVAGLAFGPADSGAGASSQWAAATYTGTYALHGTPSSPGTVNDSVNAGGAPGPMAMQKSFAARAPTSGTSTSGTSTVQPRIEKTGSVVLVVPGRKLDSELAQLMSLATANNGFVLSSGTQSASPGVPAQATATLQVPETVFETVVGEVDRMGKVSSSTTQATDVTGQYVDLQAQISSLQASRQQYLLIMSKATTVGQILAVQNQLNNVDGQLQQLQGQLQLMNNQTTYATLNVTLTERTSPPPVHHPESGLDKAWHSAVSGFVDGVEGVIALAGPLLFAFLLLSAIVLGVRWGWNVRRRPVPAAPFAEHGPGA